MLGVGGVTAVGVVAEIVAQPAGDLGHVVGMGGGVVVSLAVGVGVPLAEDAVLGLDGLADEPAAGLVRLQVILVALDAGRELGRILPRIVASPVDVPLVEPLEILVEPALDFGARRAVGMLGEELAGSLDLVGERDVGERLGADQVVDELPLRGGPAGVQLVLERPGQLRGPRRVGACRGYSRRNASIAASGVAGSSMAASERASPWTVLPALVVPDLLLGRFDLADRRGRVAASGP